MIVLLIKIIGASVIGCSGFLVGNKVKQQYKKRTKALKLIQDALRYADDSIVIENMLLDDVLINCGKKFYTEEKGMDLWTLSAENLKNEFDCFEKAWEKSCLKYFDENYYFSDKDRVCIESIGKALGLANSQRQNANVSVCLQGLGELERESLLKEEKEGKNAVKIALALSLAIIIILF